VVPGTTRSGDKELELSRQTLELSKLAEQWSSGRRNLLNVLKRTRASQIRLVAIEVCSVHPPPSMPR
jgi:hypothetical protein